MPGKYDGSLHHFLPQSAKFGTAIFTVYLHLLTSHPCTHFLVRIEDLAHLLTWIHRCLLGLLVSEVLPPGMANGFGQRVV